MNTNEMLVKLAGPHTSGSEQQKKEANALDIYLYARLVFACILIAITLFMKSLSPLVYTLALIAAVLIAGVDILAAALIAVMKRDIADKSIFLSLAVFLAILAGSALEAAMTVIIFQILYIAISYMYWRTHDQVLESLDWISPNAKVIKNNEELELDLGLVNIGDTIIISGGEIVPMDCIVIGGSASIDLSNLCGDHKLHSVAEGDELLAGAVCSEGLLHCEVVAAAHESAVSKIIAELEKSADATIEFSEKFNKFLMYFTPAVLTVAVLTLFAGLFIWDGDASDAIMRTLSIVVLASPSVICLVLPLIRYITIFAAVRRGVMFSNLNTAAKIAKVNEVAFYKSGTLSDNELRVSYVKSRRMEPEMLLKVTAHAFSYSNNKLGRAIIDSYGGTIYIELISDFTETPNEGVEVLVENIKIRAGSLSFLRSNGIEVPAKDISDELSVYLSIEDAYAGKIALTDSLIENADDAISDLRDIGISAVHMFTDEPASQAARSAEILGVDEVYCSYSEIAKTEMLTALKMANSSVMCVYSASEGIERHTAADVDVAMFDLGAGVYTLNTGADVYILNNDVHTYRTCFEVSKYIDNSIKLSLAALIGVKALLILLGVMGISSMWFSVFIELSACSAVILNSFKCFNFEPLFKKKV